MRERLVVHGRGLSLNATVTTLWVILAVRNPVLTYHFAPLLAALAWPVAVRRSNPQPVNVAGLAATGSFLLVAVVGIVLAAAGKLDGPTFWNDGPALIEVLLFAAIGAGFGARVATRERPGILGGLFG